MNDINYSFEKYRQNILSFSYQSIRENTIQ